MLHGKWATLLRFTISCQRPSMWMSRVRHSSRKRCVWTVTYLKVLVLNLLEFIYGAGKERIYVIDNTRKNASAIFALGSTIPVSYYEREYDRSTVPEFVDLLKNSMKPNDTYAMYPRVLFTDYNSDNREGLFGSRAISNVSRFFVSTSTIAHTIPDRS